MAIKGIERSAGKLMALGLLASLILTGCGGGGGSTPPPAIYTVGVSVSGLSGSGLTLQLNGADNLAISANGAATFSTPLASGAAYKVSISTQPSSPAQTCIVANGTGTIASSNVTGIAVTCATDYSVSATVSGLTGTGLVLQLNSGTPQDVIGDGMVIFPNGVASGSAYNVSVTTQPSSPMQTCTVGNGSGTIGSANVTNVTVTCALSYTIGVLVTGLSGSGLVLQLNGGDDLAVAPARSTVATIVSATFSAGLVTGANYTVTVKTQPSTPTQTCTISNSTGVVASANVTQIMVLCPQIYNPSLTNAWTWFIGDNQGFPSAGIPGSRSNFATWVDRAGNLWMFGGLTWNGIVDEGGDIGDLWYYSPATGLWTLVIGGDVPPSGGVWGTEGTAAAGNIPSGRDSEAVWTDAAGNFWLFGGEGLDSTRTDGILNDLWEYTPSTGFWTWVGGSSTAGAVGVYGTKGVASTSNVPGARIGATTWIDTSGNLWLFGGQMSPSTQETLNDLWKYNPANATWTWVSGASDVANSAGIYGTKGTASSSNSPGARYYANSFKDTSGNLWLFGGYGYDLAGKLNLLNDLWRFSPTTRTWTWIGGTDVGGALGIYGAQGTPSTANAPGARYGANAWTDAAGNFWLFAGNGFDSVGSKGDFAPQIGLNDLWKYDPTAGTWEWVSGSDIGGASSVFGTSGLASTSSMPGAQFGGGSWTDAAGHLWMFGGIPEVGAPGAPPLYLGALWVYTPAAP